MKESLWNIPLVYNTTTRIYWSFEKYLSVAFTYSNLVKTTPSAQSDTLVCAKTTTHNATKGLTWKGNSGLGSLWRRKIHTGKIEDADRTFENGRSKVLYNFAICLGNMPYLNASFSGVMLNVAIPMIIFCLRERAGDVTEVSDSSAEQMRTPL